MDPGRRLGGGGFYTKGRTSVHVSSPSHGRVYYARVPRLLMRKPGDREGGWLRASPPLLPRVVEREGCCVVGGTCRR